MVHFCTLMLQIWSKWSSGKLQKRGGGLKTTKVRAVGLLSKNQQGVKLNILYCPQAEKLNPD